MGDTKAFGSLAQGPVIAIQLQAMGRQQGDKFAAIAVAPISQLSTALPQQFTFPANTSATTKTKANHKQPVGGPKRGTAKATAVLERPARLDRHRHRKTAL
jgi:hypothetical protein